MAAESADAQADRYSLATRARLKDLVVRSRLTRTNAGRGVRGSLAACGLFALAITGADATSYSEFNAGIAARNWRNCNGAVTHMTAALAAPELLASLRPVAYLVRGHCYGESRQFERAVADYTPALALRPDDYDTLLDLATTSALLKRYDAAEADYAALIRIRPDLSKGYMGLGYLYITLKRYDDAIGEYSSLIETGSHSYIGRMLRGQAELRKGDFDAAKADADELIKDVPKAAPGYAMRSSIFAAQGKYDEALSDIEDATDYDDDNLDLLRSKGVILWQMGRWSKAISAFERVSRGEPANGYDVMWLNLARLGGSKSDDDMAKRAQGIDLAKWPGPLVKLYAGQSAPEALDATIAAEPDEDHDDDNCQADFFVGEWELRHDQKDAGIASLKEAVAGCATGGDESLSAI